MTVYFFGFRNILPPIGVTYVDYLGMPLIDATEMPNQFNKLLSDETIWDLVAKHPLFEGLVKNTMMYHEEFGNVAVACAWGKHRSQAIAAVAADRLETEVQHWTTDLLD